MWLTDLPDAIAKSGLKMVEVDGWRTRGHGPMVAVDTIVCHHTAGPATGNYPSLGIVRDGRSDLPGPLCNVGLARDGTVYIVAAGLAYHAGVVRATNYGNAYSIGIEAEATGTTAWPPAQMDAYARLCAALCEHYGLEPDRVMGHKEVCAPAGRKTDPNFDMTAFRAAVTNAGEDVTEDDINKIAAKVVDLLTNGKPAGSDLSRDVLLKQAQKASVEARDLLQAGSGKAKGK